MPKKRLSQLKVVEDLFSTLSDKFDRFIEISDQTKPLETIQTAYQELTENVRSNLNNIVNEYSTKLDRIIEERRGFLTRSATLNRQLGTAVDSLVTLEQQVGNEITRMGNDISLQIVKLGEDVAEKIRNLNEEEVFVFTYPAEGSTKSLGVGDLTIDFLEGKVTLPDGTEEHLSDNLSLHGYKLCRSLLIKTDKSLDIRFDSGGKLRVDAARFGANHMAFKTVYLHILEASNVSILGCTSPNANFFF